MSLRILRRRCAVAIAVLLLSGLVTGGRAVVAAEPTLPNVLLIVLDDATPQGADAMLTDTKQRIVGSVGVSYRNSYVAIPSCCPERSSLLTGQFPHNSGVTQQQRGGTLNKLTTLPADLHRAGYRTYHVGKFLHEAVAVSPPPGVFDHWLIGMGGYTNPYFNSDGAVRQVSGYSTTIIGNYGRRFLADAEAVGDARPWYLSLNFKAPHAPYTPEARYATLPVPGLTFPDEPDRRDKPPYISNQNVTAAQAADTRRRHYRTLASVDDQVVLTLNWLAQHGELQNTLVILTSDNGYHFGQNRRHSKFIPYTPSIQVPLWLRGPRVAAGGTNTARLVSGVDVAATIYDETGTTPSRVLDGVSLLAPPRAARSTRSTSTTAPTGRSSRPGPRCTGRRGSTSRPTTSRRARWPSASGTTSPRTPTCCRTSWPTGTR
jgi:arylsulfatase A-like enzyme